MLDGSARQVPLAGEDLESLRLAYAQHVYRQQGATVERSVVVTGGWQTSKESAYVQATRAREGTEWFLAREELGLEGQDEHRVDRLAGRMRSSRAHAPSLRIASWMTTCGVWGPSAGPLSVETRCARGHAGARTSATAPRNGHAERNERTLPGSTRRDALAVGRRSRSVST